MLPISFVETFILSALGLGSAIFVLVAILPAILPRAMATAIKEWESLQTKLRATEPVSTGNLEKQLEQAGVTISRLQTHMSDIRTVLRVGLISSALFLTGAGLALLMLGGSPIVQQDNVDYLSVTEAAGWLLAGLFGLGLLGMATFAGSFYRIVSMYIRGEAFPEEPRDGGGLVSGK